MNKLYDFLTVMISRYSLLLGRSYSHKSQFLVFAQNPVGLSQGVTISASLIIGMKQGGINSLCFLPERTKTALPDKLMYSVGSQGATWSSFQKYRIAKVR